jgi:hypothetical protein
MVIFGTEFVAEFESVEPPEGAAGALEPISILPVAVAVAAGAVAVAEPPPPAAQPAAPSRTVARNSVTRVLPVFMAHPSFWYDGPDVALVLKRADSILLPTRANSARRSFAAWAIDALGEWRVKLSRPG